MTEANKTLQQAIKHTFDQSLGIENEIEKTTFITVQRKKQKKNIHTFIGNSTDINFYGVFLFGDPYGFGYFFSLFG